MPGGAEAEDGRVLGVCGHGEIGLVFGHEIVEMGILEEEFQSDGFDVEVEISVHNHVVTHFFLMLGHELSGGGIENRGVVLGVITHVDANLRVECAEPESVVIEVMIERNSRNGQHRVRRHLPNDVILEVNPRGSQVQLPVDLQHLYVAGVLLGESPAVEVDVLRQVLEADEHAGFEPFGGVTYLAAHEETVGFVELVLPDEVVGAVVLQEIVGRLVAEIGLRVDGKRIFADGESAVDMSVDLKLAQLISGKAHISAEAVSHPLAAVLVERASDKGVVGPFLANDGVGHPVQFLRDDIVIIGFAETGGSDGFVLSGSGLIAEELVGGIDGCAEAEQRVELLLKSHGQGVAYGKGVGRIARGGHVQVRVLVEPLLRSLLDVALHVVGHGKRMGESGDGHILDDGRVAGFLTALADSLLALALDADRVVVIEVTSHILVAGHGMQVGGYILRLQFAVDLIGRGESAVLEVADAAVHHRRSQTVMVAVVTAEDGSVEQFALLVGVQSGRVHIVELGAEVGLFVQVAREMERDVGVLMPGGEAFLPTHARVRDGRVVEIDVHRREHVGRVRHAEDIVHPGAIQAVAHAVAVAVKVYHRLDGRDDVAVVRIGDGVIIVERTTRHVQPAGVHLRRVHQAVVVHQAPTLDDGSDVFVLGSVQRHQCCHA